MMLVVTSYIPSFIYFGYKITKKILKLYKILLFFCNFAANITSKTILIYYTMKKFFYFASLMLAVFMTTSCSDSQDNPVVPPTPEKTTTTITLDGVDYEAGVVATFKGEVGQEVSLTLGVYDEFDIYGVDFGDGNIVADTVCYQNGGLRDAEGMTRQDTNHKVATVFSGTIAGEGNITVYGVNKSDIWYLKVEGNAMPTSLDQEKLMRVVQASFSGANVESVTLPAMEALTQFSFTNSPVKSVDISKATALTRIDIYNTNQSAFEPQLAQIDLSRNTELETVVLGGSTYKKGMLTSLDFTNNTKLTQISAENNKLTSVTGIAPTVKNIYLNDNELATLTLPDFTVKGAIQIKNNKFTLATLPTKPSITTASKYVYYPQPAYQVAEAITDQNNLLDLSSQLTATGILTEPATTTFKILAGATELKEGEDYQVVEPGKFAFLKSQADKVHVVMATEAFPKFTGNNAYVTTEFTVNVSASASTASIVYTLAEGDTFTSGQTVEVQQGVVSITYGETGGADFKGAKADSQVEGYTAFTEGNGTNGNKTGGTFYTIKPEKDGTIEVAVVLNADKAFYIEEDGTALADYNGITKAEKYYGTFSFAAKAQKSYKVYCAGSKLGFYGFKFTY